MQILLPFRQHNAVCQWLSKKEKTTISNLGSKKIIGVTSSQLPQPEPTMKNLPQKIRFSATRRESLTSVKCRENSHHIQLYITRFAACWAEWNIMWSSCYGAVRATKFCNACFTDSWVKIVTGHVQKSVSAVRHPLSAAGWKEFWLKRPRNILFIET